VNILITTHGINAFKTVNAEQARVFYNCKNIKNKLLKNNALEFVC
jgi:hypothetical protein